MKGRRVLSMLMAVAMTATSLPVDSLQAFASDTAEWDSGYETGIEEEMQIALDDEEESIVVENEADAVSAETEESAPAPEDTAADDAASDAALIEDDGAVLTDEELAFYDSLEDLTAYESVTEAADEAGADTVDEVAQAAEPGSESAGEDVADAAAETTEVDDAATETAEAADTAAETAEAADAAAGSDSTAGDLPDGTASAAETELTEAVSEQDIAGEDVLTEEALEEDAIAEELPEEALTEEEEVQEALTEAAVQDAQTAGADRTSEDSEKLAEALENVLTPDTGALPLTFSSTKHDYYYSFTPAETAGYIISAESADGNYFDSYVTLYEVSSDDSGNSTLTFCNSDDDGNSDADGHFKLQYTLTKDTTYVYEIRSYSSSISETRNVNVYFEKVKSVTGAEVVTSGASTLSNSNYYQGIELTLTYEGGKTTSAKGYSTYYVDGYSCMYVKGIYNEQIYVQFYKDGEKVSMPTASNYVLTAGNYTVKPFLRTYNSETGQYDRTEFTETDFVIADPEFKTLTVDAADPENFTLATGQSAYYKIEAQTDQYVGLWQEQENGYSLNLSVYEKNEEGVFTRNTSFNSTLYTGSGNKVSMKMTAGQTYYLAVYHTRSQDIQYTLHLDTILEAKEIKLNVTDPVLMTNELLNNGYSKFLTADVTWSNGDTVSTITTWNTTSIYVGTGDARKRVTVLYGTVDQGETIGVVFKENDSYINAVRPQSYQMPIGKTYTLLPFVYADPENAENWAAYAVTFTYQLPDCALLELNEDVTATASADDYAWGSFTAAESGTYYAKAVYGTEGNESTASLYSYQLGSSGFYASGSSGNMPMVTLDEGETVYFRTYNLNYDDEERAYRIRIEKKYPLTEVTLEDVEASIFDMDSNGSYLRNLFAMTFTYSDGTTATTQTVNFNNCNTTYETVDDTQVYYYYLYNAVFSERVNIRFYDGDTRINIPGKDGNLPSVGTYTMKAEVVYTDEEGNSQTKEAEATCTLTEPVFESFAVDETKDYDLTGGKSAFYKIEASQDAGTVASLWFSYTNGYSLSVHAYSKSGDGFVENEALSHSWWYSGRDNSISIRLAAGEVVYLHVKGAYSGTYKGILHLDKIREAVSVKLSAYNNALEASDILRDLRSWLKAEVTWEDGTVTEISSWNYSTYLQLGTEDTEGHRICYAGGDKSERIGFAFRKDGQWVDVPGSDTIPLGSTYDVVPFVYDLPEQMDKFADSALTGLTVTLGDSVPVLVQDEAGTISPASGRYGFAEFTASEGGEYYAVSSRNAYIRVFTASESDPDLYNISEGSEKPVFTLGAGEKVLLAIYNDTSREYAYDVTVSRKYPLKSVILSDGEGTVFDVYYDNNADNIPSLFTAQFVYGEGETQTSEIVQLSDTYIASYSPNGTSVRCYRATGPYAESVYLCFVDGDGNDTNMPVATDSVLPPASTYTVCAYVPYTDPMTDESTVIRSENAQLLLEDPGFVDLSLDKVRTAAVYENHPGFFQYQAEEAGQYKVYLQEATEYNYRLSRFIVEENGYKFIGRTTMNSNGAVSFDLAEGETVCFMLADYYGSVKGTAGLKLTKLKEMEEVTLRADPDKIFTYETISNYFNFVTADYITTDGTQGTISSWYSDYVVIDGVSYKVLVGSSSETEKVGVVFKYNGDYVDIPVSSDVIYGDAEYELQAFRYNYPGTIEDFAKVNPAVSFNVSLTDVLNKIEADEEDSFDLAESGTDKWYSFTAAEEGNYVFTASDLYEGDNGLFIFKEAVSEETGSETDSRVKYLIEVSDSDVISLILHEGEHVIIPAYWRGRDTSEAAENLVFKVMKSRLVTSVAVSDISGIVPCVSDAIIDQFKVDLMYEGEDSAYTAGDFSSTYSGELTGKGKYNETITLSFYDKESGAALNKLPGIGYIYDKDEYEWVTRYDVGNWLYSADVQTYNAQEQSSVTVESQKASLTLASMELQEVRPGDVKTVSVKPGEMEGFVLTADEKGAYKYYVSDGNRSRLNMQKYVIRNDGNTFVYDYTERIYVDDEDHESWTVRLDKGDKEYLFFSAYDDYNFSGNLYMELYSGVDEAALKDAVPVYDGFETSVTLKNEETQYYTFTPDETSEEKKPGTYIFQDDYVGNMYIDLYLKFGQSWVHEMSVWPDSSKGLSALTYEYEADQQYVLAVNSNQSAEISNYIRFNKKQPAVSYTISGVPEETSVLTLPEGLSDVSVTVTMEDGRSEVITDWNNDSFYEYYNGTYYSGGNALYAQSALTGKGIYLAAIPQSGTSVGYLRDSYSSYSSGRVGDYQVHLLVYDNEAGEMVDLTEPLAMSVSEPDKAEIPVLVPGQGERSVTVPAGQSRVYRLDINNGTKYLLSAKDESDIEGYIFRYNGTASTPLSCYSSFESTYSRTASFRTSEYQDVYLVLYAPEKTQTQRIELTVSEDTPDNGPVSVVLKAKQELPVFIEGLEWFYNYFWTVNNPEGADVQVTYADGTTKQYSFDKNRRYLYTGDSYDRYLYLNAYEEEEDGTLDLAADSFYDGLAPGNYYAAVAGSSSSMPYAAPDKTIAEEGALASEVSCIPFRVISREDAVKGHEFANGKAELTSELGYYTGASYLADADAKVIFTSDQVIECLYVFDAETGETVGYSFTSFNDITSDHSFAVQMEKGRTYQVFVQPEEAGSVTLTAVRAKAVREAQIRTSLVSVTSDRGFSAEDFTVDAVYEDGKTASFLGTEPDIYTNSFVFKVSKVSEDGEKVYYDTLSGRLVTAEGTYEIQAVEKGSELLSANTVTVTVTKETSEDEWGTIALDEIKTVPAGDNTKYVFIPETDDLYSPLSNGEFEYVDMYRISSSSTNYLSVVMPGIYELKAGQKYLVSSYRNDVDQYISVTRRTPVELGDSSVAETLTPTGEKNVYLLVRATEDRTYEAEVTVNGLKETDTGYYSYFYIYSQYSSGDYWSRSIYSSGAVTKTYFQAKKDMLYLLKLDCRNVSEFENCTVKLDPVDLELTDWTLETPATALPPVLYSYYLDNKVTIKETFSDGSTNTITLDQDGKLGTRYYYNWDWQDDNHTVLELSVWKNDESPVKTATISFNTDYDGIPVLPENQATCSAKEVEGAWLYLFTPGSDQAYTVSYTGNGSYSSGFCNTDSEAWSRYYPSNLEKDKTYLFYIYSTRANAVQPTVTIKVRETKTISSLSIVNGPYTVLHQELDRCGLTLDITYTDGETKRLVLGDNSDSDGWGNTATVYRALLPEDTAEETYRYTVLMGGKSAVIDVPVTPVSELTAMATASEAALTNGISFTAAGSRCKWYVFTPAETALYTWYYVASGNIKDNYLDSIYPEGSRYSVSYGGVLEKGKTYLIRQKALSNGAGKAGIYVGKADPTVTQYAQQINYVFKDADGGNLPDEVTNLKPADRMVLQNDEPDLSSPKPGEVVEVTGGYWLFDGYDKQLVRAANQNVADSVTITGTWHFAEEIHDVSYEFVSADASVKLPAELISKLLPQKETYEKGTVVTPTVPDETEWETIKGLWTFTGYTLSSLTIGTKDETVTGTWTYADEKHAVSYVFVSGTEGEVLPETVTALKPTDQKDVIKGSRMAVIMPSQTEVETTDGRWIFTGYDTDEEAFTVRREDIVLTGTWEKIVETHMVNYAFVSDDGTVVPEEVRAYLPAEQKTVKKGTVVTAVDPSEKQVETDHGEWNFVSYDKASVTVGNDDVTITGTWSYTEDCYDVTYEFVADDGTTLPSEVQQLVPKKSQGVRGNEVTPAKPVRRSVVVGETTWSFLRYEPESVIVERKPVKFTGTWTSEEVHTVKYKFVSGTAGESLPDEITDMLPNKETWKKGETKAPSMPEQTDVPAKSGIWEFKGYKQGTGETYLTELTMGSEDVTLTGTWEFEETKVTITYIYDSGTAGKTIPDAVTALAPKGVTAIKGDVYVPVEPEQKEVDGDHGVWTFQGNDPVTAFRVGDVAATIKGTWTYADVNTLVRYTYQGTGEDKVPDEVLSLKPEDGTVLMGTVITLNDPEKTSIADEFGNWTFKGWHLKDETLDAENPLKTVTVGKTTVDIIGDWEYKAEEHDVYYVFKASETSDLAELPQEIKDLTPAVETGKRKGYTVVPAALAESDRKKEDATGTWVFDGYDQESVKMGTSDITFTGTWTHTKETHTVTYVFEGTNNGADEDIYTSAVKELEKAALPAPAVMTKGDAITAAVFTDVETTHGNWTFNGFKEEVPTAVGKSDITITVLWTYENEIHNVIYAEFKCEDEDGTRTTADAALQAYKPGNTVQIKGMTVEPVDPSVKEVTVGETTWHFRGYESSQPDSMVMAKDDITLTGIWSEKRSYQVKYEFAAAEGTTETIPASVMALLPASVSRFEDETADVSADPAVGTVVPSEHGNWTFKGFDRTGTITPTEAEIEAGIVAVKGTWAYEDEIHNVSYVSQSTDESKTIPEDLMKEVLPETAAVVKGNEVTLAAPTADPVEDTDGHWRFAGYTITADGTPTPYKAGDTYEVGTAEVEIAASWTFEEHTYGDWKTVKSPECEVDGSEERVCDACGHVETRSIEAIGHQWDEGVVTKEPTETEEGIRTYTCLNDPSHTKTEKIAKLPVSNPDGDASDPTTAAGTEKAITSIKNDGDPAGSSFSAIQAKSTKQTKNSITMTWNKVPGAAGYIVFGAPCGTANKFVKLADVKGTSFTHKGLKKGTFYKLNVAAYQMKNGVKKVIATSKTIHVITKGSKKFTNIKKIKLNKGKLNLKVKKKFKLKVTATILQSKSLKNKTHRKIVYESSNTKVATVTQKGKVKAVGKGTCYIYVYAQNGVYKRVKVTVK